MWPSRRDSVAQSRYSIVVPQRESPTMKLPLITVAALLIGAAPAAPAPDYVLTKSVPLGAPDRD